MKRNALVASFLLLVLIGCGSSGGGGGNGGGGNGSPTPTPDPNAPTPPIQVGTALYVRDVIGNDDNDGRSPSTAFSTIQRGLAMLPGLSGGRTLIVGPGTYNGRLENIPSGTEQMPVILFADPTGVLTQDRPGPISLTSTGSGSSISISSRQYVIIDGLQIRGASGNNNAGIDVRNSSHITVRNSEVTGTISQADGIAVLNSSDVVLVNNLIHSNARRGVRVAGGGTGSRAVRLINNTIARNGGQGVVVGAGDAGSEALLLFNIIQDNTGANIFVTDLSLGLVEIDTNLVFPPRYDPSDVAREFSIEENALFVDATGGDFLLADEEAGQLATSPAIDAGLADIFPADLLGELAALRTRTTSTSGLPDDGELDLGYHAPTAEGGSSPLLRTFYVRANGDDSRTTGRSPTDAFRTIRRALSMARGGDTIVVGPGDFDSRILVSITSTETDPLLILADPSGSMTDDAPGPVIVGASGTGTGFRVSGAAYVTIDGFSIAEARDAGVEIRANSNHITVRNCFIDGFGDLVSARGDGIRVDDSNNVSLVNNLIIFNDATGIQVRRSSNTRVINNTVAENGVRGIRIGSGSGAATNTLVQNNIVYFSGEVSIEVNTPSTATTTLSHNVVFPTAYRPPATAQLPRPTDIGADPRFVDSADFRLAAGSPARDAADPATDAAIRADLATRTTSENNAPDSGRLDIGYHYPIVD